MSASHFERATAVQPDGPGRFTATLNDDWNAPLVPQGGVVTSVAVRAMQATLDEPDAHRLRSVSAVFAGQVRSGELEIEVETLRSGRSMSQRRATVRNPGQESGLTAIAVFGASRPGFEFTELTMPEVAPPMECPSFRDEHPDMPPPDERFHFTFWDQVEGRPAMGHAPWEQYEPEQSDCAFWYRFDEPPFTDAGTLDPMALVTLADLMPSAVGERMGPNLPNYLPPSTDLTVHVFADAVSEWILGHNTARHAGDGYASVDLALWDPAVGLVAYGTQVMFFSFPDGPPEPHQVRPPS